jgi:hypothetical protein
LKLGRLRKGKRRREPRFWIVCQPEYSHDGGEPRLLQITVTIRNDSDVPHRLDEALIRYDDGRVGLRLPLDTQLVENIPAHESVRINVPADSLLNPGPASRFRVVAYRGRHGQRLEWSSKEERFSPAATPPA